MESHADFTRTTFDKFGCWVILMGKRISYISAKDRDFYMLNIPYHDYFILRHLSDCENAIVPIIDLKKAYEKKFERQPSNAGWSQATGRLYSRGLIVVSRKEQLYLQFSSPFVRSQIKVVLNELKKLDEISDKYASIKHDFDKGPEADK